VLKIVGGVLLLALGIVGLVLPILQGMLMIIGGLALLATEIPPLRDWLTRRIWWLKRHLVRQRREQRAGQGAGLRPSRLLALPFWMARQWQRLWRWLRGRRDGAAPRES